MQTEYRYGNLILRQLNETDAADVLDFYHRNSPYFDCYETDKPDNFYTTEYITQLLRAEYNSYLKKTFVRYFMYDTNHPGSIIGTVSFSNMKYGDFRSCIIGYKVDKAYQRQGYAYAMLIRALKAAVVDGGMHRVEAYIAPDNLPSIKLVNKLGFINEGTAYSYVFMKGHWHDCLRFVYIS